MWRISDKYKNKKNCIKKMIFFCFYTDTDTILWYSSLDTKNLWIKKKWNIKLNKTKYRTEKLNNANTIK